MSAIQHERQKDMRSLAVLLEMRPALDGHAGIPQETRLLFRALRTIEGVNAEGLIQSSGCLLSTGLPTKNAALSIDKQVNRLSKTVISIQQNIGSPFFAAYLMVLKHLLGGSQSLSKFDATHFQDFIWRALFAKTLPYADFATVTRANFRIARVPWTAMHRAALITKLLGHAIYPRLDTSDFDLMIAETPYPARVSSNTTLVIRYHDAIPILMPHTISDKPYHQASHYNALKCNVENGAHFACVSEASLRDLIAIFPEVESRAVTIPNMVSHHYFLENSSADRIPEIIRTRRNTLVDIKNTRSIDGVGKNANPDGGIDYLLIVSTIEPRKNHGTLLAAWETLRASGHPNLKLVVVGMLGWDHKAIVQKFKPWLERGQLLMLEDVPSPELRMLYRHARATICPSFGEGFDFSGVEAMRCGGAVVASDIAVHREVYVDAAEFFSPYDIEDAAAAIGRVISKNNVEDNITNDRPDNERRAALIVRGAEVSRQYAPEKIIPLWETYLKGLRKPPRAG